MRHMLAFLALGCFLFSACTPAAKSIFTPLPATASPQPTAIEFKIWPTPSAPGNSITWETLRVTLDSPEINQEYLTDYGSTRSPTAGGKFLWVHIRLKNTGQVERSVPSSEHFSVLYAATELKPTYGHRAGSIDYTTLKPVIFPDQELEGWLRFDLPTAAGLDDLLFVFIPESAQVGTSYGSRDYPYAEGKPTYVWNLER